MMVEIDLSSPPNSTGHKLEAVYLKYVAILTTGIRITNQGKPGWFRQQNPYPIQTEKQSQAPFSLCHTGLPQDFRSKHTTLYW